jgi:hypothetical protein
MFKTVDYKDYTIEIHPQPKLGDNEKVYFAVLKDDKKVFGLYDAISGTQSSILDIKDIHSFLEEKGLERIKDMIDKTSFNEEQEYEYWESKI